MSACLSPKVTGTAGYDPKETFRVLGENPNFGSPVILGEKCTASKIDNIHPTGLAQVNPT